MEKMVEFPRSASEQLELNYNRKLMKKIYVFYGDQEFVDVTFYVSNPASTVSAHRLILAAASPFFRGMFNSAEEECSAIPIAGIDSDVFERLIAFCYNGKALLTTGNVGYMLKGAMQLKLTDAVMECANYLMNHLSEYTLRKALALVNETGCELLEKRITDYTVAHFEEESQDSAHTVNELNVQQMQAVLLNPGIRTFAQTKLFGVIKQWYEHDKSAREFVLPNLIGSLQLADFDSEFLIKQIKPLPGCTDLADKAIMGREELNSLLVINISGQGEKNLLRYNTEDDMWLKCDEKSSEFNAARSVYFNKKIYYISNDDDENIYCFDLQTKTKKSLPPMLNRLNSEYLVILDEKICVIGNDIESSEGPLLMEMFNPSTDEWQTKAHIPYGRNRFGAVALNGEIYVIAGERFDTDIPTGDVYSYNPKTNIWTECAPLAEGRWNPGVAVHNGRIYVLGGFFFESSSTECMSSVECYNPERNEWTKIASLNEERENSCVISFNNELFAIGGYNWSGYSSKIEVYDDENDKWVDKKGLPYSGEFNAYVVPTALMNSIR